MYAFTQDLRTLPHSVLCIGIEANTNSVTLSPLTGKRFCMHLSFLLNVVADFTSISNVLLILLTGALQQQGNILDEDMVWRRKYEDMVGLRKYIRVQFNRSSTEKVTGSQGDRNGMQTIVWRGGQCILFFFLKSFPFLIRNKAITLALRTHLPDEDKRNKKKIKDVTNTTSAL